MAKVAKAIVGVAFVIIGGITQNPALVKFGYGLIVSNALDLVSQALVGSPRSRKLAQDIEYAGTVEPRRIIFGQMKVSGMNVIPPWTSGDGNKFLHQVLALAGHQIHEIGHVYFNKDLISGTSSPSVIGPVTGTVSDGEVQSGTYAEVAWIRKYLGTTTQTVDFILDTAFTQWDSNHRGKSVPYLAVQFEVDEDAYKNGKPEVSCLVKGALCYDPRLDSSPGASPTNPSYIAYTNNPALCLTKYLLDDTIGIGEDSDRIDWDLVVAAANICEEGVAVPPSSSPVTTQNRYTCNVVLYVALDDDSRRENLKILCEAMMGHLVYRGGKWRMYAGAAATSTFDLTADDLVGKCSIRTETPANEKYNYVRGQFVDAAREYQLAEFEPRSSAAYELADGDPASSPLVIERFPKEVVFQACTNQYEAQRNALIVLKRSRLKKQVTGIWGMSAFKIRPWDVGTMTLAEIGWDEQSVRCIKWSFNPNGTIDATFLEEDDSVWDDPAVGDYDVPNVGGGPNPGGYIPEPPEDFTARSIVDGVLLDWNRASSNPVGTLWNIYEAVSASPLPDFADATKIVSRITNTGKVIARTDPETRYYWVTAEDVQARVESDPRPEGLGIPGTPLSITTGFRLTVNRGSHHKTLIGTGSGTTTNTSTVTPIDATGAVTYGWVRTSGSTKISVLSSTSATTGFSATGLADQEAVNAVFTCTGTDSDGPPNVATITVSVSFARDDSFGS